VFLITDERNRHQAAFDEPLELALNGSASCTGQTDQFGRKESPIRLTEEKREDALLRGCKERIRQARAHSFACRLPFCRRWAFLILG
jgi:hypothetical protein